MTKMIKKTGGILKNFLINIIDAKSSRVQLVWATFLCWMFGIFYFATLVPVVRELSIIYYRENCIGATAINLDSPAYGTTILGMLGTAFMATVAGYIASNWKTYGQQDPNYSLKEKDKIQKGTAQETEEP